MNAFTVCAFALGAVGVISAIKHIKPEFTSLAAAVAGILVFVYVIEGLIPFLDFIRNAAVQTGMESYFTVMLKALAISLCCRMSAEICRDCGEPAIASRVELAGKAGIVLLSLPIIQQLLTLAKDMLK